MTTRADGDDAPDSAARLRWLLTPAAHDGRPGPYELIETHMAWLVLDTDRVLKMKKPLRRPPFLDFTTPALRERDCRDEVRLNERLAPQVYLGVLALQWHAGELALVADADRPRAAGTTIDWLVAMQRLPAERMLDRRIAEGRVAPHDIDALAGVLLHFYRHARVATPPPDALRERQAREQRVNRGVLLDARFGLAVDAAPLLDALDAALDAQAPALRRRVLERRIVDGHGDLRPEHVCLLDDRPAIIDCLEFSAELREIDPFDEIGYLGLECAAAGAPWIGPALHARLAAALDAPPPALQRCYAASRALLRARLAAAHLLDARPRTPERWLPLARRYLDCAAQALAA